MIPQSQRKAGLAVVGFKTTTVFARVDSLEVGSQVITSHFIEIQGLNMLETADLHFRAAEYPPTTVQGQQNDRRN